MGKKISLVFILLVLVNITFVSASYISGDIYISETGEARFSAQSDENPEIQGLSYLDNKLTGETSMLTRKQGDLWTFSLNSGQYENILVDVHLPRNLKSIISVAGVESAIDIQTKTISLIDSGKFEFSVSYKLNKREDYSWIIYSVIVVLLVLVVYFVIKNLRKKKGSERLDYILPMISDNEKKIIELLMKKPMRQKEIRKSLDIPKASFARYMINLENKKLIVRDGEGKNKIVRLR
jgi:uncharacterized membrane protein